MTNLITSFPPVVDSSARILILGSIPGEASLRAGQYYAHPRNTFWRILAEIIGFDPGTAYENRLDALKHSGIALWDVLHSCQRKGSLDSAIEISSIKVNDFEAFFTVHPGIKLICFNGAAAEQCYKKHVMHKSAQTGIHHIRLPSTSPAHAALSFHQKVAAWRTAISLGTPRDLAAELGRIS
jgi:TDG/mug DNA glycosylase family protein